MGYRTFVAGQYKIRQRGNKYYVYSIERGRDGKVKEHYVGPLDKIVEFYIRNEDVGSTPPQCGGWDLNPRRPTPADLKSAPFDLLGHPRN
ncbi:integrase [Sulfolobus acidocaldarius N8]|uniref:Integrase n=2 Tax=Sulfolobus acidocaldarius TaxID=2285 RepID=M1J0M6_9CREN|nr:integrase [Sulfolobus acidocaldarius N8]AGE72861.1 integrase [Sulfolobus acidocaldarius Ron12/I]